MDHEDEDSRNGQHSSDTNRRSRGRSGNNRPPYSRRERDRRRQSRSPLRGFSSTSPDRRNLRNLQINATGAPSGSNGPTAAAIGPLGILTLLTEFESLETSGRTANTPRPAPPQMPQVGFPLFRDLNILIASGSPPVETERQDEPKSSSRDADPSESQEKKETEQATDDTEHLLFTEGIIVSVKEVIEPVAGPSYMPDLIPTNSQIRPRSSYDDARDDVGRMALDQPGTSYDDAGAGRGSHIPDHQYCAETAYNTARDQSTATNTSGVGNWYQDEDSYDTEPISNVIPSVMGDEDMIEIKEHETRIDFNG